MIIDDMETIPGKLGPVEIGIFHPGEILCGRYEVLSQLGKGGMGIVYKCLDKTSGKSVALKTLAPELIQNHYEMELTKDNFNLVSELHHPYIANYNALEFDNIHGGYYLIMEFVDGEDIRYYLRRMKKEGANPEQLILKLLRQAAEALDYAHTKKVVHKDIKPANMMVDRDGNLKLLDFGLAAKIHSSMSMTTLRSGQEEAETSGGTLMYMSPEQLAGKWDKPAMDQYSLAAAAYELFSGHTPFNAPDRDSLKTSIKEDVPEPLEDVSSSIVNAISKALSKKPEDRFASCRAFVEAMAGVVQNNTAPKIEPVSEQTAEKVLNEEQIIEYYSLQEKLKLFLTIKAPSDPMFQTRYNALMIRCEEGCGMPRDSVSLEQFKQIASEIQTYKNDIATIGEIRKIQQDTAVLEASANEYSITLPEKYILNKNIAGRLLAEQEFSAALKFLTENMEILNAEIKKAEDEKLAEEEAEKMKIQEPWRIAIASGAQFSNDRKKLIKCCTDIRTLVIPDGITTICSRAFEGCSHLESVNIPESVTVIENDAFARCSRLESIKIPGSVTTIENRAFYYCLSLKNINIPDGVASIGDYAFYYCLNLTSVKLADSVTTIGENAFEGCINLESINIPDGVTSIKESAFSGCGKLKSITIPSNIEHIGFWAFPAGCDVYQNGKRWHRFSAFQIILIAIAVITLFVILMWARSTL